MKELKKITSQLSILYVEDDPTSREQLEGIFNLLFKSVDIAEDGQEALRVYDKNKHDILITDINMPKMNGLELISHIREINSLQNIIIISAHNDSRNLLEAINLGVDNFILKPTKSEQLKLVLQKVSQLIHSSKLLDVYHQELEREVELKTIKIAKQLITDELTGLSNLRALTKDTSKLVPKVMLLLNIDNFDSFNITYGYLNGDMIIRNIALFLKEEIKKNHSLYYIGADEFVIVSETNSLEEMQKFAQYIQSKIQNHSIQMDGFDIKLTLTIAISEGEVCLLKNAHIALKEAHKIGKNRISVYKKNSSIELLQRKIQEYMPKLRQVIIKRYITPYFQPIINNKTGKIEKYECLARIVNEDRTVQSPFEFIDIAELTGMITDITRIMIDKSFKAFAKNSYEFSINISEYDLNDGYLREYLKKKLDEYGIEASRVVIEVLEGISTIGAKDGLHQLMSLKEDGFSIAIDDFGVQNSNFERVHAMQVDYIKIDGSFIKNIYNDKRSYNVAKTISDFAKGVGAKVIAEYVHSKEVQDIVLELGIEYSQGYYFSEPKSEIK